MTDYLRSGPWRQLATVPGTKEYEAIKQRLSHAEDAGVITSLTLQGVGSRHVFCFRWTGKDIGRLVPQGAPLRVESLEETPCFGSR